MKNKSIVLPPPGGKLPRLALLAFLTCLAFPATSARAQTNYTWIGSGGTFSDGANWDPSGTPSGSDIAIFQGDAGSVTFSSGTTNGSNIWVDNGDVAWDIGAGNTFSFTATQRILLGSTSSGTSSLTVSSGVVNALGSIRISQGVFPDPATMQTGSNAVSVLTVTGTETEFRYQNTFFSGGALGTAIINVTEGGTLISTRTSAEGTFPNAALQLSNSASASSPNSQLNVSGAGSVADLGGSNPSGYALGLMLTGPGANSASGPQVSVTDGGYLHTAGLRLGISNGYSTPVSKVLVDGDGSKLRFERSESGSPNDNASVLAYNAAANLTIQNGGVVEAANNLQVTTGTGGGSGRNGTLEIIGPNSLYVAVSGSAGRRNVTLGNAINPLHVATLRLAEGGTMDLSNGGLTTNGSLVLAATTARVIGSGGTIRADIDSHGIISLGDNAGEFGELQVIGNYTAESDATHVFEIGGTNSSLYDHLTISGAIVFSGTMQVSFAQGFNAGVGDNFALISGTDISGIFSSVTLPDLDAGLSWQQDYNNGFALLVIPEPSTALLALSLLGVLGVGRVFRRGNRGCRM